MLKSTALLSLLFVAGTQLVRPADPYVPEIQKWQTERDVADPEGPFSLVTRFLPKAGVSSIGRDKTNDLVLPVEKAPAYVGKLEWQGGDHATLRLESDVKATVKDKPVTQVEISKPVTVTIGAMKLMMSIRDMKLRVSVVDPDSKMRKEAKPAVWFPVEKRYRITANWVPYPEPKAIRLPDSDGSSREWKSPGYATFEIDGKEGKLQGIAAPNDAGMSFMFRDSTSGHETYGAGRFLEADSPQNGKVVLDFNKAYNPLCAYNPLYVCPIPPKENHLMMRVPAGEMNYPATVH